MKHPRAVSHQCINYRRRESAKSKHAQDAWQSLMDIISAANLIVKASSRQIILYATFEGMHKDVRQYLPTRK